jgi:lysozyme
MTRITDAECDALLAGDLLVAKLALHAVFGDFLVGEARYRALINMAFNRGEKHMRESTSITPAIKAALLSGGDNWDLVATAIKGTPWAKQIGARAERLAEQLKTGVDQ